MIQYYYDLRSCKKNPLVSRYLNKDCYENITFITLLTVKNKLVTSSKYSISK